MSRPRTRSGRFLSPDNIPGQDGCEPPAAPFLMAGVVWTPADARKVGGAPIGLRLAMEWRDAEKPTAPATAEGAS